LVISCLLISWEFKPYSIRKYFILPSVLRRSRRRCRQKIFGARPGARLAALKAALAARRNKGIQQRQETGSDDEGLGKVLWYHFIL
jgi:hypothetical protein